MLQFITKKNNPKESYWENTPEITIYENEILLELNCLAFTANNISYAITGEQLGYWDFFPHHELTDFGKIPAWGFAKVIKSNHAEVKRNDIFYGYYPIAQFVKLKAEKVSKNGFLDVSPHRQHLPAIYNSYINTANDILYQNDTLAFQATFRPLFMTAFLLDDFLFENAFFDAQNIILTSASSKTSLSLAFLLQERKKILGGVFPNIIGLTSSKNTSFVENTKFYDKTILYENINNISQHEKICMVDFAGDILLHQKLYEYFGENITYNCLVGASHWENTAQKVEKDTQNTNFKKGKFFFAPTHAKKRIETLGNNTFQQNIKISWDNFVLKSKNLLAFETTSDTTYFLNTFQEILLGSYPAYKGFIWIGENS